MSVDMFFFFFNECVCVFCVKPAVNHSRRVSGVLVHVLSDQMSEADKELCGFWNPMIRPGCEMEVTHRTGLCCFHLKDDHVHKLIFVLTEKSTVVSTHKLQTGCDIHKVFTVVARFYQRALTKKVTGEHNVFKLLFPGCNKLLPFHQTLSAVVCLADTAVL